MEGVLDAVLVPLRAFATFWNAVKFRAEVSTELIALHRETVNES